MVSFGGGCQNSMAFGLTHRVANCGPGRALHRFAPSRHRQWFSHIFAVKFSRPALNCVTYWSISCYLTTIHEESANEAEYERGSQER